MIQSAFIKNVFVTLVLIFNMWYDISGVNLEMFFKNLFSF